MGAKQSTHKAVGKAGKQLVAQQTGQEAEALQRKLDDLEQKWNDVCKLSADWQQKLERTREELSKMKHNEMLAKSFNTACDVIPQDNLML